MAFVSRLLGWNFKQKNQGVLKFGMFYIYMVYSMRNRPNSIYQIFFNINSCLYFVYKQLYFLLFNIRYTSAKFRCFLLLACLFNNSLSNYIKFVFYYQYKCVINVTISKFDTLPPTTFTVLYWYFPMFYTTQRLNLMFVKMVVVAL